MCVCVQVYLKAPMILNGVCVIWRGWIDLQRLDGMGCLEYDDERAQVQISNCLLFLMYIRNNWPLPGFLSFYVFLQHEDALAQAAFEEARRRTRDFEDRDRSHREDLEVRAGVSEDVCMSVWSFRSVSACLKSDMLFCISCNRAQ